jgi:acyl-CoA thioesterase FadM
LPELEDAGRFFSEEVRVRSYEVGNNRECSIITISNMLQVRLSDSLWLSVLLLVYHARSARLTLEFVCTNRTRRAGLTVSTNSMQECASNHIVSLRGRSEQFYAADPELAKLDLIFVLTRMQIRMTRFPHWCALASPRCACSTRVLPQIAPCPTCKVHERDACMFPWSPASARYKTPRARARRGDVVCVRTYFQSEGRIGARRDWTLTDAATGEALGVATSSWVMVNFVTRRLSKMPDEISEQYKQLMPDPAQHTIEASETRLKLPPLSDAVACRPHWPSTVHMDMNNHVNNTAYLTWILDSMPMDVTEGWRLAQYEVDYKAEAKSGAPLHLMRVACVLQTAQSRCSMLRLPYGQWHWP